MVWLRILRLPFATWRSVVLDTYAGWRAHRTTRLAAGLAYYGLFAIIPLLTMSIMLAGIVLDQAGIEEYVAEVLSDMTGADADDIAGAIAREVDSSGTIAGLGLVGLGSLLLAASLVFVALQDAFDTIWEVPVGAGARNSLRRRGLAFAVVLLSWAVFVASFAVAAIAGLVRSLAPDDFAVVGVAADLISAVGTSALSAVVLALLYRFLTRAELHWSVAVAGAVITSLGLAIGHRAVAEYLTRWGGSSLAGAAGAILVVLFWVFAIAQIVLVGAELTRSLERAVGTDLDGEVVDDSVAPTRPG